MNTRLMFKNKDFKPNAKTFFGKELNVFDYALKQLLLSIEREDGEEAPPCFDYDVLSEDFELRRILNIMANDDRTVLLSCMSAFFQPLTDIDEIKYRQENVKDALNNKEAIRELYAITQKAEERRSTSLHWLGSDNLASIYSSAVELLKMYTEELMNLRKIADANLESFHSEGFSALLSMFREQLPDEYFEKVQEMLGGLKDKNGFLISADFGSHLHGVNYTLRKKETKHFWLHWKMAPTYTVPEHDYAGGKDLDARTVRALNESANALAQSAEHLQMFFARLRLELSFYIGCINLSEELSTCGMPTCIPAVLPMQERNRYWGNMYDVSLALLKGSAVTGNTRSSTGKDLYIITGANQGGKSTFLRSLGQAQIMAQCGMFVGAEKLTVPVRDGILSHFRKEEDSKMQSGKLDEELTRMSVLVEHIRKNSLILFNESFAATNEREGSEICRQITQALLDNKVEIFSVTHLFSYASCFKNTDNTEFLRAERLEDGTRTFHIVPGEPMETAFGEDLYNRIFK